MYTCTSSGFDCVDHNKLRKILKEMGIPDHLTCLLRNLYAGQEATVRTGHGTTDWFQIGKGVRQGCILSPCLFNLYAEYIMRNTVLEETQAGIKIAGRNINNFRYADNTSLMEESKERLKSLLMKVKEESEKIGLKLNIQKTKIMASSPITSWETCLVSQSCLTLCDPMDCSLPGSSVHGDSPGRNTGVGCHAFFQGIFPTQGSNPHLPLCRWILYLLTHQGIPRILEWVA